MLRHLAIRPLGGLCNRLRAIASAKRLCSRSGARCTVLWDWGEYDALFADDVEWMPCASWPEHEDEVVLPGFFQIRHRLLGEGGDSTNRRVPVCEQERIVVTSRYVFAAAEETPLAGHESAILPWLPKPQATILAAVNEFRQAHFPAGIAGLHMRGTDNREAALRSPDRAYRREADRLVAEGRHLFLGTDDAATLRAMKERYGARLLSHPKSSPAVRRWPRKVTTTADVADDLIDLWLLASCDFVVGSAGSSYSRIAMLLNGSPRCKALDRPLRMIGDSLRRSWRRLRSLPR